MDRIGILFKKINFKKGNNVNLTLDKVKIDDQGKSWVFCFRGEEHPGFGEFNEIYNKLKQLPEEYEVDKVDIVLVTKTQNKFDSRYFNIVMKSMLEDENFYKIYDKGNGVAIDYDFGEFVIKLHSEKEIIMFKKEYEQKLLSNMEKLSLSAKLTYKENSKLESKHSVYSHDIQDEDVINFGSRKKYKKRSRKKEDYSNKKISLIETIPKHEHILEYKKTNNGYDSNVVIQGEVFHIEERKIRDNYLYELKIYDFSDSITLKLFSNIKREDISSLKDGNWVEVCGQVEYDDFSKDIVVKMDEIKKINVELEEKEIKDDSLNKRVELSVHTNYSAMDGITSIGKYVGVAQKMGHSAIALTDSENVQAYPEFYKSVKGTDIKPIYGVEFNLINEDDFKITFGTGEAILEEASYVIFDVETTGFSVNYDQIIEIGAVKYKGGEKVDEFSEFIKLKKGMELTYQIQNLTNINLQMLKDAGEMKDILEKFKKWAKGSILVAHNAKFDIDHLYNAYDNNDIEYEKSMVIDTIQIARVFYNEELKRFSLHALTKYFKIKLDNAHRAIYDAHATAEVFAKMLSDLKGKGITKFTELNNYSTKENAHEFLFPGKITVLAKNKIGLKNLYKLVSFSHTETLGKNPCVTHEQIVRYREGLLVGSGNYGSYVFDIAYNKNVRELEQEVELMDFIQINPIDNYDYKIQETKKEHEGKFVLHTIKKIIKMAEYKNKIVVATGDVYHLSEEDTEWRQIYTKTPMIGGKMHRFSRLKEVNSQHYRSTYEMLEGLNYLSKEEAYRFVVTNTNKVADMIELIEPFNNKLYAPKDDFMADRGIPSIKNELENMVYDNAKRIYGYELPQLVVDRIEKELKSIIGNGFSTIYYISHLLVKKSLEDGYLVGSRGSVGSSLVATLMNITEVNPLSPHYVCPNCKFSTFKMTDQEKAKYQPTEEELKFENLLNTTQVGFDLPVMPCPQCSETMDKDGHDIPFETFLGFKGDKIPDIDLNFSGDYQSVAHEFTREMFGGEYAFRAGTVSTVASKTAFNYAKNYYEKYDEENVKRNAELDRISKKLEGVKRTTGQHPGGIVVVPDYIEITDVTPVQYPSNDKTSEWRTTHFDYHSFESNLLKLDILGHDDPTMLRFLMDKVNLEPDKFPFKNAKDIPLDDQKVYKLFLGTKVIGVKPDKIKSNVASFGVPELGTNFVRQMLEDTLPKNFSEMVKISGLSHGTDVWLNNAQSLINGTNKEYDKVSFNQIIGCRDDIMVYLTYQGMEESMAFEIMEFVRKGRPTKEPDKWKDYANLMRQNRIPEWYIWSCQQIKYMFPKAHATAYIMMALRIAWFKVYAPELFYSAYFSKRASDFELQKMVEGPIVLRSRISEIEDNKLATPVERSVVPVLYLALEAWERGIKILPPNIELSDATEFIIGEDKKTLISPFSAVTGLGENAANSIVKARKKKEFVSIEDVIDRTRVNKTSVKKLKKMGAFGTMPESVPIPILEF